MSPGNEIASKSELIKRMIDNGVSIADIHTAVKPEMGLSTFRQLAKPIIDAIDFVSHELLTAQEEIARLVMANELLTKDKEALLTERDKLLTSEKEVMANELLTSQSEIDQLTIANILLTAPKKINGWNVRKDRKGHYRLYKRIGGKLVGKYLGAKWDIEKAEKLTG